MPEVISNADEAQGIITPVNNSKKKLKEGDTINLRLSLWPKDIFLTNKVEALEGKIFLKFFYILKIKNIEISKNNIDVVNIYFDAVILRSFIKSPFYIWSVGKRNIPIEIRGFVASSLNKKASGFYFGDLRLGTNYRDELKLIVSVVIGVLITLLFFSRKVILNIFRIGIRDDKNKYWMKKFIDASDRFDYESIYKGRKEWGNIFEDIEKEKRDFFNVLNECQYQSHWTEDIRLNVYESFLKIIKKIRK
jgi:hypothetical protein